MPDALSFRIVLEKPSRLQCSLNQGELTVQATAPTLLAIKASGVRLDPGPPAAILRISGDIEASLFLRDIATARPILIPLFGFAVTAADDSRDYPTLLREVPPAPNLTPAEANFEEALNSCPPMKVPFWLSLGGDSRTFLVTWDEDLGYWGTITPWQFHHRNRKEEDYKVEWDFTVGRGSHYRHRISSRLEQEVLPVVHSTQLEDPLRYDLTLFATTDSGDMAENPPPGTQWQAAYMSTMGCMYPEDFLKELEPLYRAEVTDRPDRPVCCLRVTATNSGDQPAYAWYRMPMYKPNSLPAGYPAFAKPNENLRLDPHTGICWEDDLVFSLNAIDGNPLPNEEISLLLQPGQTAVFEARLPFLPIPADQADALQAHTFDALLTDCIDYWKVRLAEPHRWTLPEPEIDRRVRAVQQHIATNLLGRRFEEDSPLLATVGVYAPIGTESTPILWHLDHTGQHDTARRCLDYFYAIQREDGYIQSFNFYDAETGPVLAATCRHFLTTGDTDWIRKRSPAILKACQYLIERRKGHMEKDGPDHPGYGMLSGKTADPDEYFHQFILNSQAVDGLRGAARVLEAIGDEDAPRIREEAESLRQATLRGFEHALADAPLIPTADGDWVPFLGSWPGLRGEVSLYTQRGRWFTHGGFHLRALHWLHLVAFGVLDPADPRLHALVRGLEHTALLDYTGPSQPYGRRLDSFYAATGQVEKFTQLFYRQLAKLQDRETYSFWEHYYKLSSQKIHEEAWFLQQMTWMLSFEENHGLTLLKMAPTTWFDPGRRLCIEKINTIYGPLSLEMEADRESINFRLEREDGPVLTPRRLGIRIPRSCMGEASTGVYDSATEILALDPSRKSLRFTVNRKPS